MKINDIFKALNQTDREILRTAFESGVPDIYIEYAIGRFIGVNITRSDLKIEQRSGFYAEGMLTSHTVQFEPVSYADRPFSEVM